MFKKLKTGLLVLVIIVGIFVSAALFNVGGKMKEVPQQPTVHTTCVNGTMWQISVTAHTVNAQQILTNDKPQLCKGA